MTDDERKLLLLLADYALRNNRRPQDTEIHRLAERIRYMLQVMDLKGTTTLGPFTNELQPGS